MRPTKIILRRYSPAPGQLGVKINYLAAEVPVENPRLVPLAEAYKAFRAENPRRAARVPSTIKSGARDLFESGAATVEEIAKACGLSGSAVRAWLGQLKVGNTPADKPTAKSPLVGLTVPLESKRAPGDTLTKAIFVTRGEPEPAPTAKKPARQAMPAGDAATWVHIRVHQIELEIRVEDFLKLFALGGGR